VPLHPTQLYNSLLQFLLLVLLLWLLHRPHHDGEILGAWLFLSGLSSSLLTFVRGDGVVAGQFIGAVMVLAGGLLWLRRQPAAQVSHGG
jgi:phosphatidylglycerol:prolipoprotein diacylglycerol transferase